MTVRSNPEHSALLGWPLITSVSLTGLVAAYVCVPPLSPLHSWKQVAERATAYLLVAAIVNALAVWSSCRVLSKRKIGLGKYDVWTVIWSVWIAVVWLPLLAVHTAGHSVWVALLLPLLGASGTIALTPHSSYDEDEEDHFFSHLVENELFCGQEEQPLWRWLLPTLLTASAFELAIAMLIASHPWIAGSLFAAGTVYIVKRCLAGALCRNRSLHISAGNSAAVWLLLTLTLASFLIGVGGQFAVLLGMRSMRESSASLPVIAHKANSRYTGVILLRPPRPHALVTQADTKNTSESRNPHAIPFDGSYWYYKEPDTRPSPSAHIVHGDPLKARIVSTDDLSLIMEAHQPLGTYVSMRCCHALNLNLINGDANPGSITLEVLLANRGTKEDGVVSLGDKVLASSVVSPMPFNRAPVHETLTFQIPRNYKNRGFDEITVRIKPEKNRSLAAPHISIESFVLEP